MINVRRAPVRVRGRELSTNRRDVHMKVVPLAHVVVSPHGAQQAAAADDAPRVGEQGLQQLVLARREVHVAAVDGDAALGGSS